MLEKDWIAKKRVALSKLKKNTQCVQQQGPPKTKLHGIKRLFTTIIGLVRVIG